MAESPLDKPALIAQLAARIRARGLVAPATVALELAKPLGFLGSQLLFMFGPLFGATAGSRYSQYAALLEDRRAVEQLLVALEASHPAPNAD